MLRRFLIGALLAMLALPVSPAAARTQATSSQTTSPATTAARLKTVRLMNYYPANHGWEYMWLDWDQPTIDADFATIAGTNANTVRLILQPKAFGFPTPSATMRSRLDATIAMAAAHGLRVQLTLFDLWWDYTDTSGSKTWASQILGPYKGDTRISSVEVQNEIDTTRWDAASWAKTMVPYVRSLVPKTLVTISPQITLDSLLKLKQTLAGSEPDFYSFHYYDPIDVVTSQLSQAKTIAGTVPVFVGETGTPSGVGLPTDPVDPTLEAAQRDYLKAVTEATWNLDMGVPAPWILKDFAPGTFSPTHTPLSDYHWGLFHYDGVPKPAADYLTSAFAFSARVYPTA